MKPFENIHPNSLGDSEATKSLIVDAVDSVIRHLFPEQYIAMCSVYSIIGASVANMVLGSQYRPVAGLAVIDCGNGNFLRFTDNNIFSTESSTITGAYHCWIESCTEHVVDKEFVDIAFKHNESYAESKKIKWEKKTASYLWGKYEDHVIETELNFLPHAFPEGKIWVRETDEGSRWLIRQMSKNLTVYAYVTSMVLKEIGSHINIPPASQELYLPP